MTPKEWKADFKSLPLPLLRPLRRKGKREGATRFHNLKKKKGKERGRGQNS